LDCDSQQKFKMKKEIIFYALMLIESFAFAQEVQLPSLNLVNNQLFNPAFRSSKSLNVLLPSFSFDLGNNFSLSDTWNDVNGIKTVVPSKVIAKLEDNNHVNVAWNIGTVGISFNVKNWNFHAYHQIKNDISFEYSKTLAQLAWQGNAQFIGKTIEFGPSLNGTLYHEFALGAGLQMNKLTIGARVKLLNGVGNVTTQKSKLELTTSDDIYQLNFKTDYELLTSSIVNIDTASLLKNIGFNLNGAQGKNSGISFDLGLSYKINDKINIGLSILDIGSIKWQSDAKKYSSNANFQFNGFDLKKLTSKDSISFDTKLDTLKDQLHFKEESVTYSTTLPIKLYFNTNYQITEKLNLGAVIFYSKYYNLTRTSLGITANYKLGSVVSIGGSYSIKENAIINIGLNSIIKIGPVQLYGMTDNILAALSPLSAKNTNGRIGMNLIF
jgi:Family of unknown function (DUF5723)